ncbi:hypothetical protein WJX82_001119 [Trebouxia sp. C0006]
MAGLEASSISDSCQDENEVAEACPLLLGGHRSPEHHTKAMESFYLTTGLVPRHLSYRRIAVGLGVSPFSDTTFMLDRCNTDTQSTETRSRDGLQPVKLEMEKLVANATLTAQRRDDKAFMLAYMQLRQCHDGPGNSKKAFQAHQRT